MNAMWDPELVVDEALARSLVGDRLPHLRGAPMRLLGEGWDSTVWLADGEWAFRFPRREAVVPGFLREIEVLPGLAPALPLPVPVAEIRGAPDERFPWPWAGSRLVPGRELAGIAADDAARARHGRDLGRFLHVLHDVDPATATAGGEPLPLDPVRRADVCRADPGIDLMLYWAHLTPGGREAFHEAYGPVDAARLLRARVLAISIWGVLAEYARDAGLEPLGREAVAGLDRAVAGLR